MSVTRDNRMRKKPFRCWATIVETKFRNRKNFSGLREGGRVEIPITRHTEKISADFASAYPRLKYFDTVKQLPNNLRSCAFDPV